MTDSHAESTANQPAPTEQPERLDLRSHDIVSDKQAEIIRLFPEVRTEGGKIDFERLRRVLGETVDPGKERYGMNWAGKADCFKAIQSPSLGTLLPCRAESADFDTTQNSIIEGDNLEVLKLLQKAYLGKIRMIYIDPPYNTGNDFIYPDNYSESLQTYLRYTGQMDSEGQKFSTNTEADGRFHSKWLNMMYPRLYLARNLLRQDGAIFISVDDQEQDNLKKLCNEVFGEENFVACIVNVNNPKGRSDDKFFPRAHEYVLVYQKGGLTLRGLTPGEHVLKRYNKRDADDRLYREIDLRKTGDNDRRRDRPNLFYYFHYNRENGELIPSRDEKVPDGWLSIKPLREDGEEGNWRWELDTALKRLDDLQPKFMPVRKVWSVFEKDWLVDGERVKATTAWTQKEVNSERGTEQFVDLGFPKEVFPRPKPVGLLRLLVELVLVPKAEDIVLDFFAGSGTTAQAVFEMNSEDEGNRRFILVQLPESFDPTDKGDSAAMDFCRSVGKPFNISEITKERVRRAAKKIREGNPVFAGDLGFRVFKLAQSNFKPWAAELGTDNSSLAKQLEMHVAHILDSRSTDDVLFELLLKSGFPMTTVVETKLLAGSTAYSVANGALVICLDRALTLDVIRAIADMKPERVVCLDEGFAANDQLKTNAVQIMKSKGVTSFRTV